MLAFGLITGCSDSGSSVEQAVQTDVAEIEATCPGFAAEKNLYWGDLHVHTAYSLDAYGFGTIATPDDAYAFAKGEPLEIFDQTVRLERPLDFVAVTDHAEWLDLLYICTDPIELNTAYCERLRSQANQSTGANIFREYVIPTITLEEPQRADVCVENPNLCELAWADNWQRLQDSANNSDEPCAFTAFIGYEWTATPGFSHTHRNVIFANESVTEEAIDYIRYSNVDLLWDELEKQCRLENGCDAITIPHNTNMGDGQTFDVETSSMRSLELRTKYERLIEMHQEKGNSECLAPYGEHEGYGDPDCGFENYLTQNSRPMEISDYSQEDWETMRRTYARQLLLRGLEAYGEGHTHDHESDEHNHQHINPLQLGLIGSTDTHTTLPGFVDEETWQGTVFAFGDFDRAMLQPHFNPGGIVGVWAEENTRASIFAALKRREVYATSGPRIGLRVSAFLNDNELSCEPGRRGGVKMGGDFSMTSSAPQFAIEVTPDKAPISRVEIIKGSWNAAGVEEAVIPIWGGSASDLESLSCIAWTDPDFADGEPAFWYVRVMQETSPRWSKIRCETEQVCDDYPDAMKDIQERAWGSPIWYLPER